MPRRANIDIHPIRNQRDHKRALRQIGKLWGARAGSPEAEKLEVLVTLVDAYEAKHHRIELPDPIEAIRFRMEQEGRRAPTWRSSSAVGRGYPRS